jgi:GntR family transcriptional regulator
MTDDVVQPLRTNNLPLSVQAQRYLLDLVESGAYQPGERLPSEANLAAQLGISRPTLREALLNLEREGIVVRRHGVGTFVAPGYGRRLEGGLERLESILELAGRRGLQVELGALQVQEEPADPEIAERLGVAPGTTVTGVRRVILVNGAPVAYLWDVALTSVLSSAEVDKTFNGSVLDLLRSKQDRRVVRAIADIVALNAGATLARRLGIKAGRAVLLIEELLFDEVGTPIEFSRNFFVPDFFRFHIVRR